VNGGEQKEWEIMRLHELRHKGGLGMISATDGQPRELSPEEQKEYDSLVKRHPDE
jgi:hypothetical protein